MDLSAEGEKKLWRTFGPELDLILWAVWNPIGAGEPLDEYSTYTPVIWNMLRSGATTGAVADQLAAWRVERIGLNPDDEHDRLTAERISNWWYWRFVFPEEFEAGSQ